MNYAPEIAGVGRYTGDLGDYLSQHQVDVEIVTAVPHYPGWAVPAGFQNRFSVESSKGTRVTRCPLFLRADMSGIWRLLAPLTFAVMSAPVAVWRILTTRPEVVLCVEPTLFAAPVALFAARLVGARTVLHLQDLEIDAAFAVGHLTARPWLIWLAQCFERLCLKRFDRIVTISHKMAERIKEKGVAQERLFVVRNWVDLERIKPAGISVSYRDELNLPRNAFVVLYSGNLGPKQGLTVVVEAARRLRGIQNLLFVIAGDGPSKASLIAAAAGLDNVRFVPFQPREKLGQFMSLCNLHVLPQLAMAGDLVLPSKLGAMLASGRPIVVTAEPNTEIAQFLGRTTTIVPPENATALADAVCSYAFGDSQGSTEGRLSLAAQLSHHNAMSQLSDIVLSPQQDGIAAMSNRGVGTPPRTSLS
jgi:colanic acid biosynthesis glycosyl transferase WcaI